jgi:hypothetical protein
MFLVKMIMPRRLRWRLILSCLSPILGISIMHARLKILSGDEDHFLTRTIHPPLGGD